MDNKLKELIGIVDASSDFELRKRLRVHQGWWRTFVLGEGPGKNPGDANRTICSSIDNGRETLSNFLSKDIASVAAGVIVGRGEKKSGICDEDRLYDNLLSSQPLVFNFFAPLKLNLDLARRFLQNYIPGITEVIDIKFEYVPDKGDIEDHSAFDILIEFMIGNKMGFLGLECKYTDGFSYRSQSSKLCYGEKGEKNYDNYSGLFNSPEINQRFKEKYEIYVGRKYNQLFRNQLIAETARARGQYDITYTGLFTYHGYEKSVAYAKDFQKLLTEGRDVFKIITYQSFITEIQKLDLTWNERVWTMMLWARYCGQELSESLYNIISTN